MPGPPPGCKGPPPPDFGPPTTIPGQPSQSRPPPPPMPKFYGMAPTPAPAPILSSYDNPTYERSPPTPNVPHPRYADLPSAYETALSEWESTSDAHATVAHALQHTEAFAALPEDLYPPAPGSKGGGNMTPFGPAILYRSYDISILWTMLHLSKIVLLRSHPLMPPAAQMAAGVCAPATASYCNLIGCITAGMQIPVSSELSPFLGAVLTESTMPLFFAGITYQSPEQREWLVTRLQEIDRRTGWASAGIIARGCETAWEKAAEMGRGPSYKRRTKEVVRGKKVDIEILEKGKEKAGEGGMERQENRVQEVGGEEAAERRFVVRGRMPPWALNLLGTEEDLRVGMERFGL
jgi:hypothetical protein